MAIGTLIVGAISATFAATTAGILLAGTINIVASFGLGAVVRAIQRRRQEQGGGVGGVYGALRGGGVVPCSFIHGRWATAGSLAYREVWGEDGNTPNAYYVTVIALSDIPVNGLAGLVANGTVCTVDFDADAVDQGVPVPEFNVDGKDHLWVRFHDGSQTVADPYLVARFGGHADHPWTSDCVGHGVAYMVVTALVNAELFSGWPDYLAIVEGIDLYDIRKDGTAGGSGSQRWSTPGTHAYSVNPLVAAYNILRGIHYGSENFYGGRRFGAINLPFDEWAAAMNACDVAVAKSGGGTEPQYVAGGEVTVDTPPAQIIDELMTAAAGAIAESGGIFKPYVGAPGAAVAAFTDDDIVVTEPQDFDPFFGLGESINGISSRYISEDEGWQWKDAPERTYPDYEAEDGGVRNLTGIAYGRVTSPTQVQRLDDAAVKDSRRQRTHNLTLAPRFGVYEPGEVLAWTSARNGYASKLFRIEKGDDKDNLDYRVTLRETEPGDYDWDTGEELPVSAGTPSASRPPPQPMVGWQALPAVFYDDAGTERRPSIEVRYAGDREDVRAVQVQVRLKATGELAFDGELPYGDPAPGTKATVLIAVFIGAATYEARGRFVPRSSRRADWSDWLTVVTPDIDPLDEAMRALMRWLRDDVPREFALIREERDSLVETINAHAAATFERVGRLTEGVGEQYEDNRASIAQEAQIRADADGAQAALIAALEAVAYDPDTGIAAIAAATDLLETTVTALAGTVTSQGLAITALESGLSDAEGDIAANAAGLSALSTTVTAQGASIAANAAALVSVQASVAAVNANALFSIAAAADQSGASIRIALLGRVTTGDSFVEGGAYFEIVGGVPRWLFLASKFVIATSIGGTTLAPFVVSGSNIDINANVRINGDLLITGTLTTSKLADNAVTRLGFTHTGGNLNITSGAETTVQTVTVTRAANSPAKLQAQFRVNWFEGTTPVYAAKIRFKRGGTTLVTLEQYIPLLLDAPIAEHNKIYGGTLTAMYVDNENVNGSQTYTVTVETYQDWHNSASTHSPTLTVHDRYLEVLERQK